MLCGLTSPLVGSVPLLPLIPGSSLTLSPPHPRLILKPSLVFPPHWRQELHKYQAHLVLVSLPASLPADRSLAIWRRVLEALAPPQELVRDAGSWAQPNLPPRSLRVINKAPRDARTRGSLASPARRLWAPPELQLRFSSINVRRNNQQQVPKNYKARKTKVCHLTFKESESWHSWPTKKQYWPHPKN